jgi:hypothetical protein
MGRNRSGPIGARRLSRLSFFGALEAPSLAAFCHKAPNT